jgi:hypothetical protein
MPFLSFPQVAEPLKCLSITCHISSTRSLGYATIPELSAPLMASEMVIISRSNLVSAMSSHDLAVQRFRDYFVFGIWL